MKNKIKLRVVIGHDKKHKEQTEAGIIFGKDKEKTVYLTKKEAQNLLQQVCQCMTYAEAQEFVEQYK
jgi:hypothetical protein